MKTIDPFRSFSCYNAWANAQLLQAATPLTDSQLDRKFDMGVGSLRKTLLHIYNGEFVWLQRWQGKRDTPWPNEEEKATVATLASRFGLLPPQHDAFLETLKDTDLDRSIVYRDSKGSLFSAALGDMLIQGFNHSTHHRAQAANMLRHVGAGPVELDYMYWVRKPA